MQLHKQKIKSGIKDIEALASTLKHLSESQLNTAGLAAGQLSILGSMIPISGDTSTLEDYISKIQQIRDMQNVTNSSDEVFNAVKIEGYSNALKNLTSEQQALILSTQGLSTAQIQQVLAAKKAEDGSVSISNLQHYHHFPTLQF